MAMLSSAAMTYRRTGMALVSTFVLLLAPYALQAQDLIERIVAVVDEDPILLSEVDRALILGIVEAQEGETDRALRHRALGWLIEQRLRFHEVERYGFSPVPSSVVDQQMDGLRARWRTEEAFSERLEMAGVDEQGLRQLLARQLQVVTFVEERLGLKVFVSLSDIKRHYEQEVVPKLEELGQPIPPVDELREPIRAVLKEERLNQELRRWTDELRAEAEILDYFEGKVHDFPPLVMTLSEEEPEA